MPCPLMGHEFEEIVSAAAVDTKPTSFDLKQPWERGLMKFVFGQDSFNIAGSAGPSNALSGPNAIDLFELWPGSARRS